MKNYITKIIDNGSKSPVQITNNNSASKITTEMITAANAKGWNVYIGGTLK